MIMKAKLLGTTGAIAALVLSGFGAAHADSLSDVENSRAKDRAGYRLNGHDRENLRRHGRNDDAYYHGRGYGDYYGPSYGGASIYIGPRSYGDYYDD
jgi:hypothetical protein